jgi:peptide/nickel transport system permease protein
MTDMAAPQTSWRSVSTWRIAVTLALVLLLLGFASVVWTPYPVTSLDVGSAMQDPSGVHWLGTDQLGRDVLSLVMKGLLTSFVVAAVAVALGALIGIPLGLAAVRWGTPGRLLLAGVDTYLTAVPAFAFAALFALLAGPSAATVMLAAGIANIPAFASMMRDAMQRADELGYVTMSRLAGTAPLEIIRRHTLPGITRLVIAQAVTQLGVGVLAEASLAYVGLGTQPPATSLGLLLHDAQAYAVMKPGLLVVPGAAILLIVLLLNIASRGLRRSAGPEFHVEGDDGAA